ncbi:MAG: VWA domain-containing protein [Burkholderiaceae bacterium]
MKFLWPELLWLLLLVPALIALYVWLLRRRQKAVIRYAGLSKIKAAMQPGSRWRRHIPAALLLAATALMLLAVARPTAVLTLPSSHRTIVLAMDVSGSMRARDVEPSRLEAAQAAARAFVDQVPASTRIAVVEFAATASVVQPPTRSREDVLDSIDRFELQRGTAVGSGILISLKALFPDVTFNLRRSNPRAGLPRKETPDQAADPQAKPADLDNAEGSAAIILLTDGQSTTGPDPVVSAEMAAERGIRVYTVGVGTPDGFIIGSEGWSMRVKLDEEALVAIAKVTNGEYFFAGTADELKQVYEALNSKLVFEKRETEITAFFAALGAILTVLAALLSMLWFHRVL